MDDVACGDCPKAIIVDRRMAWLIDQESRARHAREGGGGAMFGSNSARWPAVWFDLVTTIEQQRVAENNARVAAEISERK